MTSRQASSIAGQLACLGVRCEVCSDRFLIGVRGFELGRGARVLRLPLSSSYLEWILSRPGELWGCVGVLWWDVWCVRELLPALGLVLPFSHRFSSRPLHSVSFLTCLSFPSGVVY